MDGGMGSTGVRYYESVRSLHEFELALQTIGTEIYPRDCEAGVGAGLLEVRTGGVGGFGEDVFCGAVLDEEMCVAIGK